MTPGIIHRINEEQACYDRDPEKYERNQRQEQEDRLIAEEELRYWEEKDRRKREEENID
jgi:hypothetical protein